MKLGFVGLGNMGRYMATNVAKAGHDLTVNDLRREAADPVIEAGASWADSPVAVARGAEAVLMSLPAPKDVEEVVTAANGVLAGMSEGSTIIDLSTNSPSMVRKLRDLAAERNVGFLDAPVSGGTRGAREATLAVMVGGQADLFSRFEPMLKAIGPNVFHTGDVGTGNVAKLINNQLAFINILAMEEALLMGAKAGMDLQLLRDIVQASSGDSFAWKGGAIAVLKDRLPPRFTTTLACKDIGLAQDLAKETAVTTPFGTLAQQLLDNYKANGYADEDVIATIRSAEEQAGIVIRGTWHD